ncbi:LOW QUALITY PROTEIN: centrosomal protein CEP57L1 [Lates calcarifer]|uniref:Centrosomal protein 57kDa-like protein 1 n=2 Tax=Lates calcarifer TaxID=8187 RepID=A0AAJ7PJZ8_LATCA|nr:LOW QUALITY PROTEIN: centrosomal protein CEP57L1 [Lates calcarifer]
METYRDQILDSPSKNSYIGSYYQPPDRILTMPRQLERSAPSSISMDPQFSSLQESQTKPNIDSKAVVDALKTLQDKIRQLELERKQAEKSFQQFSHDTQKHQQATASYMMPSRSAASLPETNNSGRREVDSKLRSAEARCKVLEKQLDYMRKMVENAKKERSVLMENQTSLQNQQSSSSDTQIQREKLEKLESECLKLSRTQTEAERKLAILEQKLLKEEHERKLVQEKADELQRELDISLRLSVPANAEMKPKKKAKKTTKKPSKQNELASPGSLRHKKMPFVAGTSLSPSHSVHCTVQSILHMMKHHQPQLCERVSALHRTGHGARKSLQKDFSPSSTAFKKSGSLSEQTELSSLSDLLLALQDELGQMSFEHQELVHQIDATQHREQKQDLQRELERLVARMEEKGVQITKLRKHQQTVHKLTQSQTCAEEHTSKQLSGIKPPVPSLVKAKQRGKKGGTTHNNLQLLRETQKFRNSLKQDDLSWET